MARLTRFGIFGICEKVFVLSVPITNESLAEFLCNILCIYIIVGAVSFIYIYIIVVAGCYALLLPMIREFEAKHSVSHSYSITLLRLTFYLYNWIWYFTSVQTQAYGSVHIKWFDFRNLPHLTSLDFDAIWHTSTLLPQMGRCKILAQCLLGFPSCMISIFTPDW